MSTTAQTFPSPFMGEGQGGDAIQRARSLRSNLTDAEKKLWAELRRKSLGNARFRRQVPIGAYIADFACYNPRMIIELDGGQHALQHDYDEKRDAWFRSQGFLVLRFWNNEVMSNMTGVLETITHQLILSPPSLTLPHKGGGN